MQAVYEFVAEEEPWGAALLSENQGAGWDLLGIMLSVGISSGKSSSAHQGRASGISARSLLQSRFFRQSY